MSRVLTWRVEGSGVAPPAGTTVTLAPERLDGVEVRGLPGRVEPEDNAYRDGNHEGLGPDQGPPGGDGGDAVRAAQAEPYPTPAPEERHGDGLHQELGM